jgi:fructose-bisphosphate aldolase class II
VPQDLLAEINANGGEIPETYGVPLEEIRAGIRHGVRKVNIDTDLRLASTAAIRKYLATHRSEFDPRKYLAETIKAMKVVVRERYEAFGTAGWADHIRPISLDGMYQQYARGALDPVVN